MALEKKRSAPKTVACVYSEIVLKDRPIAAFDFDSTLCEHRGKGPNQLMTAAFIARMSRSFNIAIFSNRRTGGSIDALHEYMELVRLSDIEIVPPSNLLTANSAVSYFGSLAHDRYRKPHRGMWELYISHLESLGYDTKCPAFAGSYFCGDAAGRPGDFAATDLTFADHCGLRFIVPEQIFGGAIRSKGPQLWSDLFVPWGSADNDIDVLRGYSEEDIRALTADPNGIANSRNDIEISIAKLVGDGRRVCIVFMGSQASGKTTLAKSIANADFEFPQVNKIGVGGPARGQYVGQEGVSASSHWREFQTALRGVRPWIVVDGTHPTVESRKRFITAAREMKLASVIVHMNTPKSICQHMNAARCELDKTNGTKEIPDVAIHTYWKKRQLPGDSEADLVLVVEFRILPNAPQEVTHFRYG